MKVTIVMPVKDRAKNTKKLLDKLAEQLLSFPPEKEVWKNIEVLVIENGSTEDMSFLEGYLTLEPFRVFHEPAISVGHARNVGLNHAKGDFICWIDNDDDISDDYLKTIYGYVTDPYAPNFDWFAWQWMSDQHPMTGFNSHNPLQSCWALWRYCFNRRLLDGLIFDESKQAGEDLIIFDLITKDTKGVFIPKILYKFKWKGNEDSLSHRYNRGEFNNGV